MSRRGGRNHQKEVAHSWAHQNGYRIKASNFFYEGRSIFSFGHHYEMGRIMDNGVVLLNAIPYGDSRTTPIHMGIVRMAVDHMEVYSVPSFTKHDENLDYLILQIQNAMFDLSRARVRLEEKASHIIDMAGKAMKYAERFGLTLDEDQDNTVKLACDLLTPDKVEAYKVHAAKAHAAFLNKHLAAITDWINCEKASLPQGIKAVYLRTNCRRPDMVETSLGVNVSVAQAQVLYRRIMKGADVKGFEIGGYTVDRYTAGVLHAGCHHIQIAEIKRFADSQGWQLPVIAQG